MMQRSIFPVVVLGYSLVFFVQLYAQNSPPPPPQESLGDDHLGAMMPDEFTEGNFDSNMGDLGSGLGGMNTPLVNEGDVQSEQEESEVSPEEMNEASHGKIPETTDLSYKDIGIQGNNVKQKEWVKQAHQIFNQVQDFGVKIEATRSLFNQKFNTIDEELDRFYKQYGVQQGKQDELFSNVLNYLEKKKQRTLAAISTERQQDKILERDFKSRVEEVEAEVKKHRTQLDQLRFNMKSIEELDRSIADRMVRLDEQIDASKILVEKGEKIVSFMWNIIDDTIAKTRYYELMNNVSAPIQAIYNYLTVDLQGDFDRTTDTIRRQISKVLGDTDQLESTGLVLVNRTTRIDDIRQQVKAEREKVLQEEQEQERKRKEALELKKKAAQKKFGSWWRRIFAFCANLGSQLSSWTFSFFGKETSRVKNIDNATPRATSAPSASS